MFVFYLILKYEKYYVLKSVKYSGSINTDVLKISQINYCNVKLLKMYDRITSW